MTTYSPVRGGYRPIINGGGVKRSIITNNTIFIIAKKEFMENVWTKWIVFVSFLLSVMLTAGLLFKLFFTAQMYQ